MLAYRGTESRGGRGCTEGLATNCRRPHVAWLEPMSGLQAATTAGIGSAVTDLIFSIAKREVTFFRGTALISFL